MYGFNTRDEVLAERLGYIGPVEYRYDTPTATHCYTCYDKYPGDEATGYYNTYKDLSDQQARKLAKQWREDRVDLVTNNTKIHIGWSYITDTFMTWQHIGQA